MRQIVSITLLCVGLFTRAQENAQGIKFENGLTWDQVKKKAKEEAKAIFLDCYATWCIPCKEMDKKVYAAKEVGNYFNKNFISVKVQFDRTSSDDSITRIWYLDVERLQKNYTVVVFPTYLFFSSDGQPLHKATSYHNVDEFLAIAKDAFNPEKRFYSILNNFQPGKMDTAEMKGLARAFRNSGTDISGKIAADYLSRIPKKELSCPDNLKLMYEFQQNSQVLTLITSYLKSLNRRDFISDKNLDLLVHVSKQKKVQDVVDNYARHLTVQKASHKNSLQLLLAYRQSPSVYRIATKYIDHLHGHFDKDNIPFIASFTTKPKDKYFNLFYKEGDKIDRIMNRSGYSINVIDGIILGNEINPFIDFAVKSKSEDKIPQILDSLYVVINNTYGLEYAEKNILGAKVAFYKYRTMMHNSDWNLYLKYAIEQLQKYGTDTTDFFKENDLNNLAWFGVFLHSDDVTQIRAAIDWMQGVLRRSSYKEASFLDTYANLLYKAGKVDEAIAMEEKAITINPKPSYKDAIQKMKAGTPTWPSNK